MEVIAVLDLPAEIEQVSVVAVDTVWCKKMWTFHLTHYMELLLALVVEVEPVMLMTSSTRNSMAKMVEVHPSLELQQTAVVMVHKLLVEQVMVEAVMLPGQLMILEETV